MAKINYKPLADLVSSISTMSAVLSFANDLLHGIKSNLEKMYLYTLIAHSDLAGAANRHYIDKEIDAILVEIRNSAEFAKFNNAVLLDGTFSKPFYIGFKNYSMIISFSESMTVRGLGIDKLDVMTRENAKLATVTIDSAINIVSKEIVQIEDHQARVNIIKNNISNIMSSDCAKQCMEQMSYDIPTYNYESLESVLTEISGASKVLSLDYGVGVNIVVLLEELRTVAVKANSGAVGSNERDYIKNVIDIYLADISRFEQNTKLNYEIFFDTYFGREEFYIGLGEEDAVTISSKKDFGVKALDINMLDFSTSAAAVTSIAGIDAAIQLVKNEISKIEDCQDMVYMGKNEIGAIGVCVEQCWE